MPDETGAPAPPPRSAPSYHRYRTGTEEALRDTREAWPTLTIYERFEQIVSVP